MLNASQQIRLAMIGPPATVTGACLATTNWTLGLVLAGATLLVAVLWHRV